MSEREQLRRALATRTARVGVVGAAGSECLTMLKGAGFPTAGSDQPGAADVLLLHAPVAFTSASPDTAALAAAARAVASHLRPGQLIVLSGGVPPGTTRAVAQPLLTASGLTLGRDFFLVYSPEGEPNGGSAARVLGGFDTDSLELAATLFGAVGPVHRVSSPEAAELCGLTGEVTRAIHAAAANELRLICDRMCVDVWEVLAACASVGFTTSEPGRGSRTPHPSLLAWGVRRYGASARLTELALEVNAAVPAFVAAKVADALNGAGKPLRGSRVAVLGVTSGKEAFDPTRSSGVELIDHFVRKGARVTYSDPHVPVLPPTRHRPHSEPMQSQPLTAEYLTEQDCALVTVDHPGLDYEFVVRHSALVVDTRNATRDVTANRERIVRV